MLRCIYCDLPFSGNTERHYAEHGVFLLVPPYHVCVCGGVLPEAESLVVAFEDHWNRLAQDERREHVLLFQFGARIEPLTRNEELYR